MMITNATNVFFKFIGKEYSGPLPIDSVLFLKFFKQFFKKNTSEQHTATDLVNLLYFLRPVSSDHSDFIRVFEQDT